MDKDESEKAREGHAKAKADRHARRQTKRRHHTAQWAEAVRQHAGSPWRAALHAMLALHVVALSAVPALPLAECRRACASLALRAAFARSACV